MVLERMGWRNRKHNEAHEVILEKSVLGVAAVDLEDRSCGKEVGNPVVDFCRCSSYFIKVVPVVTTTSK